MVGADTPDRAKGARDVFDALPLWTAGVAALGGTLGLVYGIGGAVVWLRFNHQGLPADQAVALVPKADLLVIGMRVMVLPAIAAGLVLLGLASIRHARSREFAGLDEERRGLDASGTADGQSRIREIDERLRQLGEQPQPLRALPGWARRPVQVLLALAVVALILVLPFSVGAFAWPVVLVALVAYWLRLRRKAPIGGERDFPVWRIAVAGVLAAAIISVARQTDPPIQLPSVQVVASGATGIRSSLVVDTTPGDERRLVELSGVLVTATDKQVAIGDPVRRTIVTVARSQVTSMIVGPALDLRAPPRSLLSRAFGDTAWAVTPLEFWCVNERYGWRRILDACDGHARVETTNLVLRRGGRVDGIKVRCPEAATSTCRGFFFLRKTDARQSASGAKTLVASTAPAGYATAPGRTTRIRLRLASDFIRRQWPRRGASESVHLVLALDAKGDAKLFDERRSVRIDWTPSTGGTRDDEPDEPTEPERPPDLTPDAPTPDDPRREPTPPAATPTPTPEPPPGETAPRDETVPIPTVTPSTER